MSFCNWLGTDLLRTIPPVLMNWELKRPPFHGVKHRWLLLFRLWGNDDNDLISGLGVYYKIQRTRSKTPNKSGYASEVVCFLSQLAQFLDSRHFLGGRMGDIPCSHDLDHATSSMFLIVLRFLLLMVNKSGDHITTWDVQEKFCKWLAGPTRREWGKFHPQYTKVKVDSLIPYGQGQPDDGIVHNLPVNFFSQRITYFSSTLQDAKNTAGFRSWRGHSSHTWQMKCLECLVAILLFERNSHSTRAGRFVYHLWIWSNNGVFFPSEIPLFQGNLGWLNIIPFGQMDGGLFCTSSPQKGDWTRVWNASHAKCWESLFFFEGKNGKDVV